MKSCLADGRRRGDWRSHGDYLPVDKIVEKDGGKSSPGCAAEPKSLLLDQQMGSALLQRVQRLECLVNVALLLQMVFRG